jgi:hypothetical protein
VACGSDDKAAPATTTAAETPAEWGAHIQTDCPGGDPGFDPFLAEHPEPTAADWAGFLPAPKKMLTDLSACIVASHPPTELQDDVDAVLAAMDVVVADLDTALKAAQAGDLDGVNAALTKMNAGDVEAIQTAQDKVGQAAGF